MALRIASLRETFGAESPVTVAAEQCDKVAHANDGGEQNPRYDDLYEADEGLSVRRGLPPELVKALEVVDRLESAKVPRRLAVAANVTFNRPMTDASHNAVLGATSTAGSLSVTPYLQKPQPGNGGSSDIALALKVKTLPGAVVTVGALSQSTRNGSPYEPSDLKEWEARSKVAKTVYRADEHGIVHVKAPDGFPTLEVNSYDHEGKSPLGSVRLTVALPPRFTLGN